MFATSLILQGCVAPGTSAPRGSVALPVSSTAAPEPAPDTRDFRTIANRVEPVAEGVCNSVTGRRNCDFRIVLDTRPDRPPNAFQTLEANGRPLLVVNATLLTQMRNADEIAFVLSHEAAHHIADHIPRQQQSTYATAVAAGMAAAALGASQTAITAAQEVGAFTGSRAYSKAFELEADTLGAQIAYLAGYDPVRGVEYFTRARDPGDVFLGTHPPNAQRIEAVRETMAQR
jgi:predicted Zn-dependent protease